MENNKNNDSYNGASLLPEGTVLHGKYEIKSVLGVGGFGITYSAVDIVLQTQVAVKEYFPSSIAARKQDAKTVSLSSEVNFNFFKHGLEKFLVEARDVAKFNQHPNIVSVFDYFEENSTAYMVMEYLSGMTLKQYYAAMNGNIPQDALFNIASSVIYALSIIHSGGLIHRDISPDNIYMCEDGTIKIIDFGAAKEDMKGDTKTVSVVLKQGYAPIEQYSSKTEIGPWTDIYAFGATLYYLATGVKPEVSIDRAISDNVCPPKDINPNITDTMNRVIMKAMAVRAQDRYQSVYDMSADLNNINPSQPAGANISPDGTVLLNNTDSHYREKDYAGATASSQNNNYNNNNNTGLQNGNNFNNNVVQTLPPSRNKSRLVPIVIIVAVIAIVCAIVLIILKDKKGESSGETVTESSTAEGTEGSSANEINEDEKPDAELISKALEVLNSDDYMSMDITCDITVNMDKQASMDNLGIDLDANNVSYLGIDISIKDNMTGDEDTLHENGNIDMLMAGVGNKETQEVWEQIDGDTKHVYEYDSDIHKWVHSEEAYQSGSDEIKSDIILDTNVEKNDDGYILTGKLNTSYIADEMDEDDSANKYSDVIESADIDVVVEYDLLKNLDTITIKLANELEENGIAVKKLDATIHVVEANADKTLEVPSNVTDAAISEAEAEAMEGDITDTTEETPDVSGENTTTESMGDMDTNPNARYLMNKSNEKIVYVDILIPAVDYKITENNMVMFQGKDAYVEYGLYLDHNNASEAHKNILTNPDMQVIENAVELTTDDGISVIGSTFLWKDKFGEFAILTRELPDGTIMYVACQYDDTVMKDWNLDYLKNLLSDKYLIY